MSVTIPVDYPWAAPLCYVEPTERMELTRGSQDYRLHPEQHSGGVRGHVETSTAWMPEHSSLIDVIVDMCQLFSRSPPVRARSAAPQAPPGSGGSPQPPQPYGPAHGGCSNRPANGSSTSPYGVQQSGNSSSSADHIRYPPAMYNPAAHPHPYPQASNGHAQSNPYSYSSDTGSPFGPPAHSSPQNRVDAARYPGMAAAGSQPPPPQPPGSFAQPPRPQAAVAKDAHEEPFKRRAIEALAARLQASLDASCEGLSEEVVRLESTAEQLAQNRQV